MWYAWNSKSSNFVSKDNAFERYRYKRKIKSEGQMHCVNKLPLDDLVSFYYGSLESQVTADHEPMWDSQL